MKKMLRNAILLIIVLVGFAFIPSNNVEALSAEEKIYGYGVYLCYTDNPNGYYPVLGEITLEQFKTWSDIIHLGSVPAKSTESRLKATTTCKGAFEKAGKTASTSSVDNKNKALENYGYVGKTVGECMSFSFQRTPLQNGKMSGSTETIRIQGLCSSNPGNVSGDNSWLDKNSNAKWPVGFTFQNNVFKMGLYDPSQKGLVYPNKLYPLSGSLSSLMDSINSDIKSHFSRNTNDGNTSDGNNFIYSDKHAYLPIGAEMVPAADNSTKSKFELENRTQAALKLLGIGSVSDLMFTKEEKYALYNEYLNSIYGINASNVVCDKEASPGDNYVLGAFKIGGMYKACWANAYKNNGNTVNALGGNYFNGTQKTWQDLVRELYEDFKDQIGEVVPEETQEDAEAEGDGDTDCQSSGAAQSLGWIVCPILNWMERTSTNLYEEYVEPALIVDPGLFNNGPGVKQAWDTFQRISNTIFIVLLLVIIISQITGFGIDNYGIKKILPKLIVVAILTNLSYYICLIAVDVSNIVGSSVQSMFTGLGNGLNMSVSIEGSSKAISSTAISAVAVLGALVTMGTAVWANPAIVLTLFVSAIGVVFSIFFLFIILAAREAAVVVLVVAAPVAIACYILPNTKKVFDSWMRMFGGLLLVFPICGLLVGGGNYISKLLLSTGSAANGVFNAFAAMVVGIVPIFFIPSVLKNSFGAMGNLGAKIAGVGKTVGGGVQRAATNSNLNRSLQESGAERRARFMGGLNADGTAKDLSTVGRMIRGGSRNIARNRATALGNMDKRFREKRLMGTGYDAALAGMNAKVEKAAVEDAQALIESGAEVNPNDVSAMNYFHADALREYHNATTDAGREAAMARIQAAQNIMAKTDKGRAGIQTNYENALRNNEARGVTQAASHLMSNYGAQIKNVNRGEFGFISDLSTAQTDAVGNIDTADYQKVLTNMNTDVYNAAGTDKYTPESLANADEMALDRLYNSMGSMTNEQRRNIQSTVRNAISKSRTTNLNIKPEVRAKMEKIDKWRPPTVHNPNP